jgi:hypothetical protein
LAGILVAAADHHLAAAVDREPIAKEPRLFYLHQSLHLDLLHLHL